MRTRLSMTTRHRGPRALSSPARRILSGVVLTCCVLVPLSARATIPAWQLDLPEDRRAHSLTTISGIPTPPPAVASNQASFDVESYSLVLRPDFSTETLDGQVHIVLTSLVDGLDRLYFDLYDNLPVTRVFTDWGDDLYKWHQNDVLQINLRQPLDSGEALGLTIVYSGSPQPTGFMGFDFTTTSAGAPILATLSEPYFARSWWPCKDLPDDKATVTVTAFAPTGMSVAGNGVELGVFPVVGGNYYVWQENYPISTYNVSLAIASYDSWSENYTSPVSGRSMPIDYLVFPEDRAAAEIDFQNTAAIMDHYESLFGEYPFIDDKYGMAEFVWAGAMEHQTMTSYGDFFLTGDQFYERIVGHEMAHQWFGNKLTVSDWNEIWLHEGFATYAEALWLEQRDGVAAYHAYMDKRDNDCCGFWGPVVPPLQLFNDTVYFKGAWVLHMLRKVVGDGAFFQALRDLVADENLQYGNFTTADVVAAFSRASKMELNWFFDQWLYRSGRPTLGLEWNPSGAATNQVEIRITQSTDDGVLYTIPIDVRVVTTNGSFDTTTWVGGALNLLTLSAADPIVDVQLDPDHWVLHYTGTPVSTPAPAAIAGGPTLLPNQPNPFNPATLLRFELPSPSEVSLRILDSRGRVVDVLRPGALEAGPHALRWDGRDRHGAPLGSGVYRVELEARGHRAVRSITLVR